MPLATLVVSLGITTENGAAKTATAGNSAFYFIYLNCLSNLAQPGTCLITCMRVFPFFRSRINTYKSQNPYSNRKLRKAACKKFNFICARSDVHMGQQHLLSNQG